MLLGGNQVCLLHATRGGSELQPVLQHWQPVGSLQWQGASSIWELLVLGFVTRQRRNHIHGLGASRAQRWFTLARTASGACSARFFSRRARLRSPTGSLDRILQAIKGQLEQHQEDSLALELWWVFA